MQMPKHDTPSPPPEPESPLAAALQARGFAATPEAPAPAPKKGEIDLAKNGKIVVRRERKGRGGKTVTLVSGIERATPQLEEIARAMRKALGCGSTLEGHVIVLLGDIVPRAQAWLQAHGATKIVQGT
jgi:translation initiation factor 1